MYNIANTDAPLIFRTYPDHAMPKNTSLNTLFEPRSIAVVGASNSENKAGYQMMAALECFGGAVYPINPTADSIFGKTAYASLSAVGATIDLAIFTIPAQHCIAAARDAASAGVGAIMIISGGFTESGAEGETIQEELLSICRAAGMRLMGPNTSGFSAPGMDLRATFVPGMEKLTAGKLGIIAQSGAINVTLACMAIDQSVGVSLAVGTGNSADMSTTDVIHHMAQDPNTSVIAVYLEGVSDGRQLYEAIQLTTPQKPVVIFTVGKSDIGEFAASHTGNLIGSFNLKIAALKQAGAIIVESTRELIEVASMFAKVRLQPNLEPGVALITGQAGPGMVITDYLKSQNVSMPVLHPASVEAIAQLLPPMTYFKNPVDTGRPSPDFVDIARHALDDAQIDAAIVFALHEPLPLTQSKQWQHCATPVPSQSFSAQPVRAP